MSAVDAASSAVERVLRDGLCDRPHRGRQPLRDQHPHRRAPVADLGAHVQQSALPGDLDFPLEPLSRAFLRALVKYRPAS
ncbi:hypothetical protein V5P93_004191 [Actinokineospora auranticolor]|uniref:hypothetical protein n=1 Tax=Actinokineospora auranticolor TaxID=155976 RepID=UPI0035A8DEBF